MKKRADQNELSILFAYDTLSSRDHDKFRVVFVNDVPIHGRRGAEAVQLALGEMFPEADPSSIACEAYQKSTENLKSYMQRQWSLVGGMAGAFREME